MRYAANGTILSAFKEANRVKLLLRGTYSAFGSLCSQRLALSANRGSSARSGRSIASHYAL